MKIVEHNDYKETFSQLYKNTKSEMNKSSIKFIWKFSLFYLIILSNQNNIKR